MPISPIIRASELSALLTQPADLVLIDARQNRDAFRRGHLRGARHADLDSELSAAADHDAEPSRGGRHPLPPIGRWAALLGFWGIHPSTMVVIYDDQSGANAAARVWWMLRAVGHEQVAVLDGGFDAAVAEGLDITSEVQRLEGNDPYPAKQWQLPMVDADRVDELRTLDGWKVLDVRSAPRFRGETEPIDPIAGHIPGAINLPFSENLNGPLFKDAGHLRDQYVQLLGGVSPDHLVVHCGSGVTACHTLLALEAAGLRGASLYVGSWSEWCRNDRPRAGTVYESPSDD